MDFVVPKLSATMETATVLRWLKQPGERVKLGEPIVELETDKAAMEVESTADGTLEAIVANDGEVVPIGGVLATLNTDGGVARVAPKAQATEQAAAQAPAQGSAPAVTRDRPAATRRIPASPLARRLAMTHGVDLATLNGSGPGGRVRKRDVLAAAGTTGLQASGSPAVARAPSSPLAGETTQPLSPMRLRIAESVSVSRRTIPSFALDRFVETNAVEIARQSLGREVEQRTGLKLTLTDFLLQAMADTLAAMPQILGRWVEEGGRAQRVTPATIDIGLVVAVNDGMIIPVVRDLRGKSLAEIARLRTDAVQRVRSGRLIAADGAPFSIALSNLGKSGVDRFEAIIGPGQSSILAAGREHEAVVARGGAIVATKGVNLTFSVDHRLIDGLAGANFIGLLADRIELGPWSAA